MNPLFHVPHYLAFRYLSAGVLVFATGAVQGSQLLLLYLVLADPGVCQQVFLQQDPQKKMGAVLCPLERSKDAGN